MNKRELSKVERPEATEDMFSLAEKTEEKIEYLVMAEIMNISDEKILLLNFFERSQLVEKKTGAAFRTFISQDDYITQDLKTTRTKWKTGSFDNLIDWGWIYEVVSVSAASHSLLNKYMKKYNVNESDNVWKAIQHFQRQVMKRRLEERHKKETAKIDSKMELVPEIPKGFKKWAHDVAMGDKRYLVYDAGSKKKITSGFCTCCKKTVDIDTRTIKPRNKQRGKCPACGGEVTFIPKGYFPTYQRDRKWGCLVQKINSGIVVRYFHIFLEIQRDNNFKEEFCIGELCRVFYQEDNAKLYTDRYDWDVYKQHGSSRWCPGNGKHDCGYAVLYTENLPQAFKGTIFQYCAVDIYQKKNRCEQIPFSSFLDCYPEKRFLEYFIKSGMFNMTKDVVEYKARNLNTNGKTPMEVLELPKEYIKKLIEIDGTGAEYRLIKQCYADKVNFNANDIHEYYIRFGGNDEMLGVVNTHMSIGKFIRYIDKQRKKLPVQKEESCCNIMYRTNYTKQEKEQMEYKNIANDWRDYISWCATLKYDMNDMYVILPPNLKKAHDRVMKEYQEYREKQERRKKAILEKKIKKVLKDAEGIPALEIKTNKLTILVPKSGEEIKEEGRALHHCVGTYVERVAKGETMILFVRRIDKPTEPYFTLEYRNEKVIQCRGKNNCSMTNEVKAFVKAFEAKMQLENNKDRKVQKVS